MRAGGDQSFESNEGKRQMVTTELLLWEWKEQLERRPASHRLAAVSVVQRLSVLAVQQPADGHCEHSPKLNTVSGLVSE